MPDPKRPTVAAIFCGLMFSFGGAWVMVTGRLHWDLVPHWNFRIAGFLMLVAGIFTLRDIDKY